MHPSTGFLREPDGLRYHGGAVAYALCAWSVGVAGILHPAWSVNLLAVLLLAHGMVIAAYMVHECQTPVAIFPEMRDGKLYFHAQVPQGAPTIRALLAMIFEAVNGEPPETVLAIPTDFVRQVMDKLGLGTREVGLNAMVERLRRAARAAAAEEPSGSR